MNLSHEISRVKWSKYAHFRKDNTPSTGYLQQAMDIALDPHHYYIDDILKAANILISHGTRRLGEFLKRYAKDRKNAEIDEIKRRAS